MKFAVGITLYNPTDENIQNILNYMQIFDIIFIYDNSTNNESYQDLLNNDKIVYYCNGNNDGLCIAINLMIEASIQRDIDYLCTMDQDSVFENHEIRKVIQFINSCKEPRWGIVAPYIVYKGRNDTNLLFNEIENVNWVITSGSFVNIANIKKYGIRYDENYFIDKCDIDFCTQIRLKGLKVLKYYSAHLYQELGYINEQGFSEHSSVRHYYIARNRVYYNRKFYDKKRAVVLSLAQLIKHLYTVLRYEKDKKEKIKAILAGVRDYHNGLMGKRI